MSRNKVDHPHPTPNPDGPHTPTGEPDPALIAGQQAAASLSRDSGTDEIPLSFAHPGFVPDPFLESTPLEAPGAESVESSEQTGRHAPPEPSLIAQPAAPSGDSFAVGAPRSSDVTGPSPPEAPFLSALAVESPDPELLPAGMINLDRQPPPATAPRTTTEPETEEDVRVPWTTLMLLAYSTALTMLLTWLILTGRLGGSRAQAPAEESQNAAIPREIETPVEAPPAPPIPPENTVDLGGTIRLGDLEATPLGIEADAVSLVRSIDSDESRRADSRSLILRIRFTNRSRDVSFRPIERAFLREQPSRRDRSEITTSNGKRIAMFSLAVDSEWVIQGQSFESVGPGESVETVVASEPGVLDRLTGEAIWRLRVRTGLFRSDMLGVRFRPDQVDRRPAPDARPVDAE